MLYYLFNYLDENFDLAGAGVFQYISFRSGLAIIISLLISMAFGKKFIQFLQKKQIGESVRDLGLEGQKEKQGTPTMGGVIIITCILIPALLLCELKNIYVILLIISTLWTGMLGFLDDYIKVFKKNKDGLSGKFKIVGQIGLGLIVGLVLFFHDAVVVRQYEGHAFSFNNGQEVSSHSKTHVTAEYVESMIVKKKTTINAADTYHDEKSTITTIPFFKDNELDYGNILPFLGKDYTWIVYVLVVIVVVTAVSNGANITDGIDGLAAGTSAIIGSTLGILAYVSGNTVFADYLNIMYLPNTGEIVIFSFAFVGACIGFLWYNSYPAKVFMGDTGSLCIGGIIAVIALAIRKELLIPILCGIFLVENLSVIMQVSYFKYTKKKYGEGKRIFKMSPLHHHYQKSGMHESKIVTRFWIVGVMLAIVALATLKLR